MHSFASVYDALHEQAPTPAWQPTRVQLQPLALWQHSAGPPSTASSHAGTGFLGGASALRMHSQEDGAPTASHCRLPFDDEDEDEPDEHAMMSVATALPPNNRILRA